MATGNGTSVLGEQFLVGLGTGIPKFVGVSIAGTRFGVVKRYGVVAIESIRVPGGTQAMQAFSRTLWVNGVAFVQPSAYVGATGIEFLLKVYWNIAGIPFFWETR